MAKGNGAAAEPEDDSEDTNAVNTSAPLTEYKRVRCSFVYHKNQDYEPYLCYRCMRFLAKRHWAITFQLIPSVSTASPNIGDI